MAKNLFTMDYWNHYFNNGCSVEPQILKLYHGPVSTQQTIIDFEFQLK